MKNKFPTLKKIVFLLIVFVIFPFVIISLVIILEENSPSQNKLFCSNLPLENTTKCIINYTSDFYKFSDTPDNIERDEEALRREGGDCMVWSFYIEDLIENNLTGFYANKHLVKINETHNHMYPTISNEEGWCSFITRISKLDYYCIIF